MRLLSGVVRRKRVLGHCRHASDAEGDAEEDKNGLAEINQGLCRVRGRVVKHRDEEVVGAKRLRELDDDRELVDEEVVGGVDDDGDKVEVVRLN